MPLKRTPPWPIEGPELLTQLRWVCWSLEGGDRYGTLVTKAAADRGGETIAGLTWRCYSEDYLRLPTGTKCPIEQFQQLTLDDVVQVMLEVFALRTNLWKILDPRLRLACIDEAINSGPAIAIENLQRALGLSADGVFGPVTERAVNACDVDRVREQVLDARYQRDVRIAIADRSQLANLLGWTSRCGKVLRWRAAAALLVLLTSAQLSAQPRTESSLGTLPVPPIVGMSGEDRTFHRVPLERVKDSRWTHIESCGVVTLVKHEADGDAHIRLDAGGAFLVVEIVPYHHLPLPKVKQTIVARGISRLDRTHGWYELHPLESWKAVATCDR